MKSGSLFARIDDRAQPAYPGLALVVISGARPVALRRVNYYEDFQFMGLFDPHPDYPYMAPKELTVEGGTLAVLLRPFGLRIANWSIGAGQSAAAGAEAALIVASNDKPAASLRVPRSGLITEVRAITGDEIPPVNLFSLLYYDNGAERGRPLRRAPGILRAREIAT